MTEEDLASCSSDFTIFDYGERNFNTLTIYDHLFLVPKLSENRKICSGKPSVSTYYKSSILYLLILFPFSKSEVVIKVKRSPGKAVEIAPNLF